MQTSRNPDAVRSWLDARVAQGFDKKALKAMLRMSSDELAEVCDFLFFCSFSSFIYECL